MRSLPTTSGLETEWDYSGRQERDGQKKKIVKATQKREEQKRAKYEEVKGQGKKGGAPAPHGAIVDVNTESTLRTVDILHGV